MAGNTRPNVAPAKSLQPLNVERISQQFMRLSDEAVDKAGVEGRLELGRDVYRIGAQLSTLREMGHVSPEVAQRLDGDVSYNKVVDTIMNSRSHDPIMSAVYEGTAQAYYGVRGPYERHTLEQQESRGIAAMREQVFSTQKTMTDPLSQSILSESTMTHLAAESQQMQTLLKQNKGIDIGRDLTEHTNEVQQARDRAANEAKIQQALLAGRFVSDPSSPYSKSVSGPSSPYM